MATSGTQQDPTYVRGVSSTGAAAPSGTATEPTYSRSAPANPTDLAAVVVAFNATAEQTLVPGVAGQTTRVHRLRLYVGGATTLTVRSSAAGTTLEVINFPGAGSIILDYTDRPYWTTTSGGAFTVQSSAAVQVNGRVEYIQG